MRVCTSPSTQQSVSGQDGYRDTDEILAKSFDHMQAADTTSQLINYSLSLLHDDLTFQYSILRMLLHVTVPKSLQEIA